MSLHMHISAESSEVNPLECQQNQHFQGVLSYPLMEVVRRNSYSESTQTCYALKSYESDTEMLLDLT